LAIHEDLRTGGRALNLEFAYGRSDAHKHALQFPAILMDPWVPRGSQRLEEVLFCRQPVTQRHLDESQLRGGASRASEVISLARKR
jgi:hypothetical protein